MKKTMLMTGLLALTTTGLANTAMASSLPVFRGHPSALTLRAPALYDAVAVDDATQKLGYCINGTNKIKNELCALSVCTRNGGTACRTVIIAEAVGGYGAVAIGRDPSTGKAIVGSGTGGYQDVAGADQMALRDCEEQQEPDEGSINCRLRAHWYEGRPGTLTDGE
ncbi:MAG: DUF4189 domain-containing protein [Betaproteobacteria bacterium]|nr:DUF4189 domain-containing protein [Betaproteobacteria bacterium]